MLDQAGVGAWEACEQETHSAIALTERWLASGISRRAARASDWHLSRCMLVLSHHFPTLLPGRFNASFEHVRDHGRLHARAMAIRQRRRGVVQEVDADGYVN